MGSLSFVPPLTTDEIQSAFVGTCQNITTVFVGGQGAVFRAKLNSANGPAVVALKIYFPGQVEERTTREISALHKINCKNLVRLVQNGKITIRGISCTYVATEFIEGEALAVTISRGPLELKRVIRIGLDIATAIHALWEQKVVHRDVKPQNIMWTSNESAVLIDLGVARHLTQDTLTSYGATFGTMGYMSRMAHT